MTVEGEGHSRRMGRRISDEGDGDFRLRVVACSWLTCSVACISDAGRRDFIRRGEAISNEGEGGDMDF